MKNERQIVFCDCGYPGHQLIFEIWEEENFPKELLIYVRLNNYLNIWKRIYHAAKYVFGSDVRRIDYMDMIITNPEELKKIKNIIDEMLNT